MTRSRARDRSGVAGLRHILVGAEDELPLHHVWYEGKGYSLYAAEQPKSSWREHSHDCVQVTIGLEPAHVQATWTGSKAAGQRELNGNLVSIIPPGEPHSTLWQRRAILIHLYLGNGLLEEVAKKLDDVAGAQLRPVYLVRDLFVEELGRVLFRECRGGKPAKFFVDGAVGTLVTHLLRAYGAEASAVEAQPGGLGPARERKVREYVERHLDGDLSIHALADAVGMNPQYFASAFRVTTGFTPHRYVSHRRIAKAQQWLAESEQTIVEIAYRCGFKSQGQFTTLFRQFTGMTPGRFRMEKPESA